MPKPRRHSPILAGIVSAQIFPSIPRRRTAKSPHQRGSVWGRGFQNLAVPAALRGERSDFHPTLPCSPGATDPQRGLRPLGMLVRRDRTDGFDESCVPTLLSVPADPNEFAQHHSDRFCSGVPKEPRARVDHWMSIITTHFVPAPCCSATE
jgi:hypothetical protein